jgi:hypothetical protein
MQNIINHTMTQFTLLFAVNAPHSSSKPKLLRKKGKGKVPLWGPSALQP